MVESTETPTKGTILLTGANGGLGVAMAKRIVSRPDFVASHEIYAVRHASSARRLRSALQGQSRPQPHDIISLDLTRLDDVCQAAADINSRVASGEIPPIRSPLRTSATGC